MRRVIIGRFPVYFSLVQRLPGNPHVACGQTLQCSKDCVIVAVIGVGHTFGLGLSQLETQRLTPF